MVEVLCLDAVLAEHLVFPQQVNVLDVVAASQKDVGVGFAVEQHDVIENCAVEADVLLVTQALLVLVDVGEVNAKLVLEVLIKNGVKVVEYIGELVLLEVLVDEDVDEEVDE
eukprot:5638170-Amphidinium_carterae.1